MKTELKKMKISRTQVAIVGWMIAVVLSGISMLPGFSSAYAILVAWGTFGGFVLRRHHLLVAHDPYRYLPRIGIWTWAGLLMAWPLAIRLYR